MKYKLNLHFVSILTFSRDSKSQMVKQKHHSHGRTHGIKWLGTDEFRKFVVPNGWTVPFVWLVFKSFFYQFKKRKMLKKDALFDSTIFNDGKESKPLLSVDEKGKLD